MHLPHVHVNYEKLELVAFFPLQKKKKKQNQQKTQQTVHEIADMSCKLEICKPSR